MMELPPPSHDAIVAHESVGWDLVVILVVKGHIQVIPHSSYAIIVLVGLDGILYLLF